MATLAIAALTFACFEWSQPRFEGRTAREWVKDLVRNEPNARRALIALGADAVPALIEAVEQKQSRWIRFLDSLRPNVPKFVARHLPRRFEAEARGQRAVEVLYELGTNAAPAVPALIRNDLQRDNWWEFTGAHAALINVGAAGAPQFIRVLRSRDPRERVAAARYLGEIGPAAHKAAPYLARLIRDPDSLVQTEAVAALAQIGPSARAATPNLRAALTTTNVEFRLRVAESLWYVDHDSQTITPILVAVLSNRNDPYRPKAAALLGLMGPGAAAAVPTLKSVTNEDFSYTRVKAEEALSLIGKSVEVPAPHSPGSP
jgi:hypothetical protein